MPIPPKGTSPISTRRPDSFSQSSDPTAMAIVKTVMISVTTRGPPAKLRTRSGICANTTEPSSQNHDTPRIERNTALRSRAKTSSRHVSLAGFQP